MGKIITYIGIDDDFLNSWHALWEQSDDGHFFNTPEWFLTYLAIKPQTKYLIITLKDGDTLTAVLPLVHEKQFGIPVLRGPGGKFLNKSSLLMKSYAKAPLKELFAYLMQVDNIYLSEVSQELADMIQSFSKVTLKKESSLNPYLPLEPDPFHYLSSKNRSQIRGILRKNEANVEHKVFVGDRHALEVAFEIDSRSSKKKQGKATFVSDRDKAFCLELIERMPKNVVIDLLYYNKIPIVYSIGFTYKKIYHAFNTAFDAEYRFLRPGKLLAYLRVKALAEEGYTLLDFGRGNSVLKQEFTKEAKLQYDIYYSSNPVIRSWWNISFKLYHSVEHNKRLYNIYLTGKKTILPVKSSLKLL